MAAGPIALHLADALRFVDAERVHSISDDSRCTGSPCKDTETAPDDQDQAPVERPSQAELLLDAFERRELQVGLHGINVINLEVVSGQSHRFIVVRTAT